ncbi:hypothetical protein Chor_016353 [Crotalus horridus]
MGWDGMGWKRGQEEDRTAILNVRKVLNQLSRSSLSTSECGCTLTFCALFYHASKERPGDTTREMSEGPYQSNIVVELLNENANLPLVLFVGVVIEVEGGSVVVVREVLGVVETRVLLGIEVVGVIVVGMVVGLLVEVDIVGVTVDVVERGGLVLEVVNVMGVVELWVEIVVVGVVVLIGVDLVEVGVGTVTVDVCVVVWGMVVVAVLVDSVVLEVEEGILDDVISCVEAARQKEYR